MGYIFGRHSLYFTYVVSGNIFIKWTSSIEFSFIIICCMAEPQRLILHACNSSGVLNTAVVRPSAMLVARLSCLSSVLYSDPRHCHTTQQQQQQSISRKPIYLMMN